MSASTSPMAALSHGFPNLEQIRRSLLKLHTILPRETFRFYSHPLSRNVLWRARGDTLLLHVQRVARRVGEFYRITPEAVRVMFGREMAAPAHVELGANDDFCIQLHPRFEAEDFAEVPALLVHEVTHIFLHKTGISFPDPLDNEILTDTTAAYLGAGWTSLNAYTNRVVASTVTNTWVGMEINTTTRESAVGYLTPEEFGYVLARRDRLWGDNSLAMLEGRDARRAFRAGRKRLCIELNRPPLATCGVPGRLRYWWRSSRLRRSRACGDIQYASYRVEANGELRIAFDCPTCSRKLRLPIGRGKVQVTCATCGTTFACRT